MIGGNQWICKGRVRHGAGRIVGGYYRGPQAAGGQRSPQNVSADIGDWLHQRA